MLSRILVVSAALTVLAPPIVAQTTYGSEATVRLHSTITLDRNERADFRQFQRDTYYFGAFAVNTVEDAWAWVDDYHDLQTAMQAALIGCRFWSTDANANACVLYASVVPAGFTGNQSVRGSVNMTGSEALNGPFREGAVSGTYGAFAVSGLGEWGYATEYPTAAQAADEALAQCNAALAATLADYGPEGRAEARQRRLDRCTIIARTGE